MHCSFIMFTFTMFTCNLYIKQCNRKPLTDGNSVTVLAVKMCNSIMQKKKTHRAIILIFLFCFVEVWVYTHVCLLQNDNWEILFNWNKGNYNISVCHPLILSSLLIFFLGQTRKQNLFTGHHIACLFTEMIEIKVPLPLEQRWSEISEAQCSIFSGCAARQHFLYPLWIENSEL